MSGDAHVAPSNGGHAAPSHTIKNIIYSIRRLMQAGEIYTKELNRKNQISIPQLNCLLVLFEKGTLPPSQIARQIMVNSSTVTGIIDRLEQKKLVRRVRNTIDRRLIYIELTEAGETLAQHAPPPLQHKIMSGLSQLTPDQIAHIESGLGMLVQMLDVQIPDGQMGTKASGIILEEPLAEASMLERTSQMTI